MNAQAIARCSEKTLRVLANDKVLNVIIVIAHLKEGLFLKYLQFVSIPGKAKRRVDLPLCQADY
jgi:hypothetical protein